MIEGLQIKMEKERGIRIVEIYGAIDFEHVDEMQNILTRILETNNYKAIVKLADCERICSMGIGVLIGLKHEARLNGGDLRIVTGSEMIVKLFGLIDATKLLEKEDDIEGIVSELE